MLDYNIMYTLHKDRTILEKKELGDPTVRRIHARIAVLKSSVSSDKKTLPCGLVLVDPSTAAGGKSVVLTHYKIKSAYKKLVAATNNKTPTTNNIAFSVACAMLIANELGDVKKVYKVELALSILRKLINENIKNEELKELLHIMTESLVPSLLALVDELPGALASFIKKCKCCVSEQ